MATPATDPPGRRRLATPADADSLRAIQRDCLAQPAPELLAGALDGAGTVVVSDVSTTAVAASDSSVAASDPSVAASDSSVAASDPSVVGYALAIPGDEAATLAELAVVPAARRRGHGRALVGAVVEHCRSNEVGRLVVHASRADGDARSFYDAMDFRRTDVVADYYDDGSAAVVYERSIDGSVA